MSPLTLPEVVFFPPLLLFTPRLMITEGHQLEGTSCFSKLNCKWILTDRHIGTPILVPPI